ncbi:MAG: hypothetical protein ACOWWM_17560 [Desulfobacterales bacterium]
MRYFSDMARLLMLDGRVYDELLARDHSIRYCVFNIVVLGLIYGVSSLYFARRVLANSGMENMYFSPVMVLLIGVSTAFLMHGGAALFVWVFCRGIGGCPMFMPPYLNLGVASIALWPVAPALAAFQAGAAGVPLTIYGLVTAAYAAAAGYVAIHKASGLTQLKMAIAAVATLVYIACFLYLWM